MHIQCVRPEYKNVQNSIQFVFLWGKKIFCGRTKIKRRTSSVFLWPSIAKMKILYMNSPAVFFVLTIKGYAVEKSLANVHL